MYCKNSSCFNEETCKKQCRECDSYDHCSLDREMDTPLKSKEQEKTLVIETTFKIKS